jgi:ribosomal protein S2
MIKHFKLFNLTLANSKLVIRDASKHNTPCLTSVAIKLKSALRVIHKFHINKKKIIFVGNPLDINKQLTRVLKKTKHAFIPRSAWIAGHMTNKLAHAKISHDKYDETQLFSIHKLKKKGSLVIIIDQLWDLIALNEFHSLNIPIISLNSKTKMLDETIAIKVPAKLVPIKSNLSNVLFYSLLLKIFQIAKNKKYKRYYFKRLATEKRFKFRKRRFGLKKKRRRPSRSFRLLRKKRHSKKKLLNAISSPYPQKKQD